MFLSGSEDMHLSGSKDVHSLIIFVTFFSILNLVIFYAQILSKCLDYSRY